jgi:transcriptional regulator with XRE-family HTH domain
MNELVKRLRLDLEDQDSRYVYVDTITNAFIAAQIRGLREKRGLSQEQLAALMGTKQSGVSRLEQSDYSIWKVETLRRLAKAFGVRLRIRFEEFGTLLDEVSGFDDKNLLPRRFEDDPVFKIGSRLAHRKPRVRRPEKRQQTLRLQRNNNQRGSVPRKLPGHVGAYNAPLVPMSASACQDQSAMTSGSLSKNKMMAKG